MTKTVTAKPYQGKAQYQAVSATLKRAGLALASDSYWSSGLRVRKGSLTLAQPDGTYVFPDVAQVTYNPGRPLGVEPHLHAEVTAEALDKAKAALEAEGWTVTHKTPVVLSVVGPGFDEWVADTAAATAKAQAARQAAEATKAVEVAELTELLATAGLPAPVNARTATVTLSLAQVRTLVVAAQDGRL
jgi:hypothetical protein